MAPRKDTPEYEAWKNSPEYEAWRQKLSEKTKQQWQDPERESPRRGKLHSDATKTKISISRKGIPAWNKGIPTTEEQKAKLSNAQKGRKHTEEWKRQMSEINKGNKYALGKTAWNKGIPMTEEQKAHLSNVNKGKQASDATRAKMSASQTGKKRNAEFSKKMSEIHKGKTVSAKTREKQATAKRGKPGNRTGIPQSPETIKRMSQISRKQWDDMTDEQKAAKTEILRESTKAITKSALEEVIALELDEQGIVYERQKRIGWYRVDFYIPDQNQIIEAQGCFWHACKQCGMELHKKKREADTKRHEYLIRKGYSLNVIWEHERKAELRKFRRSN